MKRITQIHVPVFLNELGNRENNEDAIFPRQALEENNLFLVCDGVGGQAKGEIASALICEKFPEYFSKNKMNLDDERFLVSGLQYVEAELKASIQEFPEREKMASTLTLLYLDKERNKALLAWVGDSRIYHIRDGEIQFQTKDHSEVQQLLDMGEISEEEAENHPRKNVITRAISGVNPTRIDQRVIADIQENDFFFLCTDGILENLNASTIKKWFKAEQKAEDIAAKIRENAKGKTKDNYSMYLIKIKEAVSTDQDFFIPPKDMMEAPENGKPTANYSFVRLLFLLVILALLAYTIWHYIKG